MFKSKNPKTTATGIAIILGGIFHVLGEDVSNWDFNHIGTLVLTVMTGTGLLVAKDGDK